MDIAGDWSPYICSLVTLQQYISYLKSAQHWDFSKARESIWVKGLRLLHFLSQLPTTGMGASRYYLVSAHARLRNVNAGRCARYVHSDAHK
jgi:hypothetical protein